MDKLGCYNDDEVRRMLGNVVLAAFVQELLALHTEGRISPAQYNHFYDTHITLKELVA